MKEEWLEKYRDSVEGLELDSTVLTAFNANIDETKKLSELEYSLENVDASPQKSLESEKEFRKALKHLQDNGGNLEVPIKGFSPDINGERQIGGQAGIMANFLSRIGNRSIIYTPFLSKELADKIDSEVLYPSLDDGLVLKKAKDAVNTDRTKTNYIVESKHNSSRLILSDSLRGFGAYFRKGVEDRFPRLQEIVDKMLFSGFHDMEGNVDAKLKKAEKQLRKLHIPKHLEMASKHGNREKIVNQLFPIFTSIGLDESELKQIAELEGYSVSDDLSLGDAYLVSKKLIQDYKISRVHVHTTKFHITTTRGNYPVKKERIRDSMLFSCLAATTMAGKGDIPQMEDIEVDADWMRLTRLDDLEHFESFFNLEDFTETGTTRLEEFKVAAIPTILHEEPERLVGLGDVISAGAFIAEDY